MCGRLDDGNDVDDGLLQVGIVADGVFLAVDDTSQEAMHRIPAATSDRERDGVGNVVRKLGGGVGHVVREAINLAPPHLP